MTALTAARRHVELVTGSPDTEIYLRFLDDPKTGKPVIERKGSIEKLWPEVVVFQKQNYGVFLIPNADTVAGDFACDEDIARIRTCFIDADGIPEPDAWHIAPAFIVRTSPNKFHAYWIVDDLPVTEFEHVQRQFAAHYKTDPTVCNPSRIMRLAGTIHWKNPADPHVVTLDDRSVGRMPCEIGCTVADLRTGLAELSAKHKHSPSPSSGKPVTNKILCDMLGCIDPDTDRDPWRNIIAAIRSAPIIDEMGESLHRRIAHVWSEGKLDRLARYKDTMPTTYTNAKDVDQVFDSMPPKPGGITVATIIKAARDAGYQGPTAEGGSSQEAFGEAVKKLENSTALHAVLLAELLARPVPPVEEVIAGLVEKGIMTMLSGPGGRHKSRLLLQWLLCIAAGEKVFGRSVMAAATCIYLSSEDHADEVARRTQAIVKQLNLPRDIPFQYHDLTLRGQPLAILSENDGLQLQPFYAELRAYLLAIPGHKVLGLDSCYNFLQFNGKTKIDEGTVKAALELLNRLCAETDTTIIMLWHPSQAGQERGDASGWSVAWHNTPRARLSLSDAKDGSNNVIKDAFELRVEKRNNAAKGDPITLHWNNGALLPNTDLDIAKEGTRLLDACVAVALMAAENGQPLQRQKHPVGWVITEIEKHAGFRPTKHRIKEELATAQSLGRLRYINGNRHRTSGYYPPDMREANDLAHEAKHRTDRTAPGEGESIE